MSGGNEPLEFGAEYVRDAKKARLETAREEYSAILNRLWAGNGGGLVTTLTAARYPSDVFFILSLGCFSMGLIVLAIGAIGALVLEARAIRELENAASILDLRVSSVVPPSKQARLTISHPQFWAALLAAILFVIGVVLVGFLIIARH